MYCEMWIIFGERENEKFKALKMFEGWNPQKGVLRKICTIFKTLQN